MTRRFPRVLVCLMLVCAVAACADDAANLRASLVDVNLQVLPDGSVLVRETLTLDVGAEPVDRFDRFERRVSGEWADDFIDVSASMDGVRLSEGDREGAVRVRRANHLYVQWRFAQSASRTHTFMVAYRAMGAVGVAGLRGTLRWHVLESGRAFPVQSARVTLELPNGTSLLGTPSIGDGGWRTSSSSGGETGRFTAERDAIDPAAPALLTAEMTMESLAVAEPRWQDMNGRARDLIPAFLAAALFIIVTGLGVVWMIGFQYPRPKPAAGGAPLTSASSAMRMAVVHGGRIRGVPELLATVLDLAVRDTTPALPEHERIVIDELLPQAHGGTGGAVHAWSGVLPRDLRKRFRRALSEDLIRSGLADPDRLTVANGLRRAGFAVLLVGVIAGVLVPRFLGELGIWPMAVPASIVIVAGMLFAVGARFRVLTAAGEQAALDWR